MQSDKSKNNAIPSPEEQRIEHLGRKVIGFFLCPIAVFPLLALITYDWHAIEALQIPAISPTTNLIGPVGDHFAYWGYTLLGIGVWVIPLLCIFVGLLMLFEKDIHPGRRTVWLTVFTVALCCLLQLLGGSEPFAGWLVSVNAGNDAGGALGHLIMTRFLSRLLSPFGSGVLMISVMLIALALTIGLREIAMSIMRAMAWATGGEYIEDNAPEGETRAERKARKLAEKERLRAEKAAEKERRRQQREEQLAAIKAAKEAARLENEAEKTPLTPPNATPPPAIDTIALQANIREEFDRQQQEFERQQAALHAARPATQMKSLVNDDAVARVAAARAAAAAENHPERLAAASDATATPPSEPVPEPVVDKGPYMLPEVGLLRPVPIDVGDGTNIEEIKQVIISTLSTYGVKAAITGAIQGPTVTQYAVTPETGYTYGDITKYRKELQGALMVETMRVFAPIPGKNAVGLEVPNSKPLAVHFRTVLESETWKKASQKMQIPLLIGRDIAGNDLVADLTKLPHLLVAGATGKGKSVGLNSMICGLLMCRTPQQLKFIMVDPKRVEFTGYNKLPHLLIPVVNDNAKVVFALKWAVQEMSNRLKTFAKAGVRDIATYNNRTRMRQDDLFGAEPTPANPELPDSVPYIVIVVDEVADIMQTHGKEVEPLIGRLTALARATGIHLILATQRPDTKVITGTIKGNIPGRIAFKTSSNIDSRTILDAAGAEQLIGNGDMLYKMPDGNLVRAQGSWIKDEDIASVLAFIEQHANTDFDQKFTNKIGKIKEEEKDILDDDDDEQSDSAPSPNAPKAVNGIQPPVGIETQEEMELYVQALEVVRSTKRASTSHLQRKMKIGYNHAARLMDQLEENGIIGPSKGGSAIRDILVDLDEMMHVPQLALDGSIKLPGDDAAPAVDEPAQPVSNTNEELIWTSDQPSEPPANPMA